MNPTHYEQHMVLTAAVTEARQNHAYWLRQKALRTEPEAKAKAAALATVWKSTLAARKDAQEQHHTSLQH